jgi:hypothetical protein
MNLSFDMDIEDKEGQVSGGSNFKTRETMKPSFEFGI